MVQPRQCHDPRMQLCGRDSTRTSSKLREHDRTLEGSCSHNSAWCMSSQASNFVQFTEPFERAFKSSRPDHVKFQKRNFSLVSRDPRLMCAKTEL